MIMSLKSEWHYYCNIITSNINDELHDNIIILYTLYIQLAMEDVIAELPSPSPSEECMDQSEELDCYYPPRLTYAVQAASQSFPPAEQLDCTIEVRGALEANRGKALFFNIRSKTSPHHRNGELYVWWNAIFRKFAADGVSELLIQRYFPTYLYHLPELKKKRNSSRITQKISITIINIAVLV